METVPDTFPSLFAGYGAMWLVIFVYVAVLARRLSRLEKKR